MKTLILVPTQMERLSLVESLPKVTKQHSVQLSGFGAIAAAAVASQRLSQNNYQRVFLTGIAGTYNEKQVAVGEAYSFDYVQCDGIGVGSGPSYQSSSELGWNQIDTDPMIRDRIKLNNPESIKERSGVNGKEMTLLTGCSASADALEAHERAQRYPTAVAEDMEGFGVAMACQLEQTPLTIIRGISNQAGDRNHHDWKIKQAMQSAAKLLAEFL